MGSPFPLISVIIPVYNAESFLPRALDSLLQGSYENIELICVNDGSRDGSLALLRSYAEKDQRVKVFDYPNGGVSVARNKGLDEARGDYITFVDADDWVHRDYLITLLALAREYDADIALVSYQPVKEDAKPKPIRESDFSKSPVVCKTADEALTKTPIKHFIVRRLYRAELLKDLRFPVGIRLCEDSIFNLLVLCRKESAVTVYQNIPLYFYFDHPSSTLHSIPPDEYLVTMRYCLACFDGENVDGDVVARKMLEEAAKLLLSYRYQATREIDRRAMRRTYREARRECLEVIRESGLLPPKEERKYRWLANHFILYQIFRVIDEPAMIFWGHAQRKRRREAIRELKRQKRASD